MVAESIEPDSITCCSGGKIACARETIVQRIYTERTWEQIPHLQHLDKAFCDAMRVVAKVLPFRVNSYVLEHLIDWDCVPDDPIFRLVFPQPAMLASDDFSDVQALVAQGSASAQLCRVINDIRQRLNPHPAGRQQLNVPEAAQGGVAGLQHKYPQTVLFFPSSGQTCHTYCTFCFRWPQFVGIKDWRFAAQEATGVHRYLRQHREVSDLLVTGGDPLVSKTRHLSAYLEPLLKPEFDHLQNIRIGTKSLTYWPFRFLVDDDADDLLRLFERLTAAGKHVALMAHYNHWRELEPEPARRAIQRIRGTGATIRAQGPLLAHINDDAAIWIRLWTEQVRQGIVPYYMFVERNTGPHGYFAVPLHKALEMYRVALRAVSGLARTVRGPVMSAGPGKIEITDVTRIQEQPVFALRFLQARYPQWCHRLFFARLDAQATWLSDLRPAFGERAFFFEPDYRALCHEAGVTEDVPL